MTTTDDPLRTIAANLLQILATCETPPTTAELIETCAAQHPDQPQPIPLTLHALLAVGVLAQAPGSPPELHRCTWVAGAAQLDQVMFGRPGQEPTPSQEPADGPMTFTVSAKDMSTALVLSTVARATWDAHEQLDRGTALRNKADVLAALHGVTVMAQREPDDTCPLDVALAIAASAMAIAVATHRSHT